ncbi:MAG: pyridoxamine 5'-phosphate oxidase family protein [Bacteroides sp.]|nr:pyridoxamine 5'-phosphate oxidase family protein [Prevotella sp.]MCM1408147.1 pyridoxamine 5'-phosphate oxidase family protein [Treponema brennaborense]MCM1469471.1 pyridoxamine 5'-phosphate oxidase family protein [Bacteroides sp.]
MNRKDREITDPAEIIDLLNRCDTLRLGLINGDFPYIVPVSFGLDVQNEKIAVYFHCAKKGLKVDCINKNQNVCIEGDIFYKVEHVKMGITARYESVVGFGTVCESSDEEKMYGLTKILEHYNQLDYPLDNCKGLPFAAVYKIELHSLTGKRNLPNQY